MGKAMTIVDSDDLADMPIEDRWKHAAPLLRVVAHPVRLAILATLCEHPHCVKHLNALITIPQAHLSQHIAALRKVELVACCACGPVRCYYLLKPTLVKALVRLLWDDHPNSECDCQSVVREARKNWEDQMEQKNWI